MDLIEYAAELHRIATENPDVAKDQIIVRNMQGFEYCPEDPLEVNWGPPYFLGCILGLWVDSYVSNEDRTWFRSDSKEDITMMQEVIECFQSGYGYDGDRCDPYALSDDEVVQVYDALPWIKAIVAGIGIAD